MSEETTAAEGEAKEFSPEIKELGDKLAELTLKQAVELGAYLKAEYEIEPAAAGAVMMAGSGGEAAAEAEEQTSFDVILKDIGDKKIQVIKAVRADQPGAQGSQGPGGRRSKTGQRRRCQGRGRGGRQAAHRGRGNGGDSLIGLETTIGHWAGRQARCARRGCPSGRGRKGCQHSPVVR